MILTPHEYRGRLADAQVVDERPAILIPQDEFDLVVTGVEVHVDNAGVHPVPFPLNCRKSSVGKVVHRHNFLVIHPEFERPIAIEVGLILRITEGDRVRPPGCHVDRPFEVVSKVIKLVIFFAAGTI